MQIMPHRRSVLQCTVPVPVPYPYRTSLTRAKVLGFLHKIQVEYGGICNDKPILPDVIYGSHKAWPKDKFFMRPCKIFVYILEPIYPSSFLKTNNPSKEELAMAVESMTLDLEQKIKEKAKTLYG